MNYLEGNGHLSGPLGQRLHQRFCFTRNTMKCTLHQGTITNPGQEITLCFCTQGEGPCQGPPGPMWPKGRNLNCDDQLRGSRLLFRISMVLLSLLPLMVLEGRARCIHPLGYLGEISISYGAASRCLEFLRSCGQYFLSWYSRGGPMEAGPIYSTLGYHI